jgi:folate-binding protein YgfZ
MSEPQQPIANPLRSLHQQAEAEFQAYAQVEIVSTFGEPQAEYAAIRKSAALLDEPQRGILEVSGADRFSFLSNLLTNQIWNKDTKKGLSAGEGVYAFFLNTKGRIVSDVHAIETGDRMLLDMDARMVEPLRVAFDKFLFREQMKMTNRVGSLHTLSLHGPGSIQILNEVCPSPIPDLPQLGSINTKMINVDAAIWRDDVCAAPGFHVVIQQSDVQKIWTDLCDRFSQSHELGKRRLRPAGWAAYNACRIEGGRPIFGIDFDESVLPPETGQMDRAVSLTKGCYLGQEIVARMVARGQVARQLVGIRMADDALPIAGAQIYDDKSNSIGGITSSTISPVLSNAAICLGYVKKQFIPAGTVVNVPAEGSIRRAVVTELPFFKKNDGAINAQ